MNSLTISNHSGVPFIRHLTIRKERAGIRSVYKPGPPKDEDPKISFSKVIDVLEVFLKQLQPGQLQSLVYVEQTLMKVSDLLPLTLSTKGWTCTFCFSWDSGKDESNQSPAH